MWVSYQAANGHVSLLLNATDGKFNGVKYIQEMVEDIGATSSAKTTSTLEKEIKIKYVADSDNPRLTYKLIKRPGNDECKYDPSVEHFVNTEIDNNKLSYQCFYQWDYPDKVIKNLNNAANAAEDGYITIKQACDIFTNPDNWDSDKKKR